MLQTFKTHLQSVCPLIMHNGQLANPFNAYAKALKLISQKSKKTEADLEEMAKISWHGSLYLLHGKPCLPGNVLDATLMNAAKKIKKGQQAKAGMWSVSEFPLNYDGPQTLEELWEDTRFQLYVGVRPPGQRGTIMRMRPLFPEWEADVEVNFNDDVLSQTDMQEIFRIAGRDIGFMDWRPRYGRFAIGQDAVRFG